MTPQDTGQTVSGNVNQDAVRQAQLQQIAAWAFAIKAGGVKAVADAQQHAEYLGLLYDAANELGAAALSYGTIQQVIRQADQMQAAEALALSANNPFSKTKDPAGTAKQIQRTTPAKDRAALVDSTPESERALIQDTGVSSEQLTPPRISQNEEMAELAKPQGSPSLGSSARANLGAPELPEEARAEENGGSDGEEALDPQEEIGDESSTSVNGEVGNLTDENSSVASGKPWFDKKGGHKITGQKLTLYGQRTEAVGRAARIASRSIRKHGGKDFYGGAKKVENFGRSAQKGGKVLQKAGTYLAAAQSIKELSTGDIKKGIATAVRTGGSLLITRLAFWVSGLFGLTIKGLIITAVVWNIILFISILFHLNIPKWMRWAIIAFDALLPILVIVIIMFILVAACYVAKSNTLTSTITEVFSHIHPGAWAFNEFCKVIGK